MQKILIIEDNIDLAKLVQLHLKDLDCDADIAVDGKEGLRLASSRRYALVILDLMLPEMDGLEVCRRMRSQQEYVPIVMLTSKATELDRIVGLETGADDYVTKPFSIPELMARVKAQLRRSAVQAKADGASAAGQVQFGDLMLDLDKHQVFLAGRGITLTAREFDLLRHFASHPGRVFNRAQLLEQVWGHSYEGYEHTVNSHINRLRNKIEKDPARPQYILTVWGVGYRFADRAP